MPEWKRAKPLPEFCLEKLTLPVSWRRLFLPHMMTVLPQRTGSRAYAEAFGYPRDSIMDIAISIKKELRRHFVSDTDFLLRNSFTRICPSNRKKMGTRQSE